VLDSPTLLEDPALSTFGNHIYHVVSTTGQLYRHAPTSGAASNAFYVRYRLIRSVVHCGKLWKRPLKWMLLAKAALICGGCYLSYHGNLPLLPLLLPMQIPQSLYVCPLCHCVPDSMHLPSYLL
jgi:hypothetical protein